MKIVTTTLGVILGVFGVWLMAAAQTSAPPDAGAIAGKWTMTIDAPIGAMTRVFTATLDGKKVTGGLSRADGNADDKVEGLYVDGKLTFTAKFEGYNGPTSLSFEGRLAKDGSLAGTVTLEGAGTVDWTATKIK